MRRLKELTRLTCLKEFKGVGMSRMDRMGRNAQGVIWTRQAGQTDARDGRRRWTQEIDAGDRRTRQTQEIDAGDRRRRRTA